MIYLNQVQLNDLLEKHGFKDIDTQVFEYRYDVVSRTQSLAEMVELLEKIPLDIAYPIECSRTHQGYASVSFLEKVK